MIETYNSILQMSSVYKEVFLFVVNLVSRFWFMTRHARMNWEIIFLSQHTEMFCFIFNSSNSQSSVSILPSVCEFEALSLTTWLQLIHFCCLPVSAPLSCSSTNAQFEIWASMRPLQYLYSFVAFLLLIWCLDLGHCSVWRVLHII